MKKKALSLALALAMCLGLTVPAFASGGFGGGGVGTSSSVAGKITDLTVEDVTFSVDPVSVATIQFMKKDGSEGPAVTAYMFDKPVSVSMKDGRAFTMDTYYEWVDEYGLMDGIRNEDLTSAVFLDADYHLYNLWTFSFMVDNVDGSLTPYRSPYMVSKSYVDSLIEEGHKVDIQPYAASQPSQPTTPTQPETPAQPQPSQPSVPNVPDAPGSYTVKKGDTWSSICTNFYGDNSQRYALMKANKKVKLAEGAVITLPEKLGKAVLLPAPAAGNGEKLYTVKAGDTLGKIAAAEYGKVSEYKAIFDRNKDRLKNVNLIYEGQVIVLPVKK